MNQKPRIVKATGSSYPRTCFHVVISVHRISKPHAFLQVVAKACSVAVFAFGTAIFASASLMSISITLMLLCIILPTGVGGRVIAMWIVDVMSQHSKPIINKMVKSEEEAGKYFNALAKLQLQMEVHGHVIVNGSVVKSRHKLFTAATYFGLLAKPFDINLIADDYKGPYFPPISSGPGHVPQQQQLQRETQSFLASNANDLGTPNHHGWRPSHHPAHRSLLHGSGGNYNDGEVPPIAMDNQWSPGHYERRQTNFSAHTAPSHAGGGTSDRGTGDTRPVAGRDIEALTMARHSTFQSVPNTTSNDQRAPSPYERRPTHTSTHTAPTHLSERSGEQRTTAAGRSSVVRTGAPHTAAGGQEWMASD
ncbi:hypothetical protein F5Y15DRAFT_180729 [Xylariaceae sp. FL0016]|nr:hypothetical protein F5Y15DRAFT_180729 [Xylariaceae sp. FL0016]